MTNLIGFIVKIIHSNSNHGWQYFLREFSLLIKEYNAKIFMSHIDNPLDNCEIEYLFSSTKLECLNHIRTNEMIVDEDKVKVINI